MKFISFVPILMLLLPSCIHSSVDVDNVCSYKEIHTLQYWAGKRVSVQYVTQPNFEEAITKFSRFGDVKVTLKNAIFSTKENIDLSFVDYISISFVREDGSELLLTRTNAVAGDTLILDLNNLASEVTQAVSNGNAKFHIYGTGTLPDSPITITSLICASVHAEGDGSIKDFKNKGIQ